MEFDKQESAGYLVNHMARLFAKELQQRIQPLGIVPGQFPILLELWEKDGVTQSALLGKIDVEQATLANTLIRMERDGLIRRVKHPSDARAQQIWLTEKASSIKTDAYQAAGQINSDALVGLNSDDRAKFLKLMRTVISTLHQD